MYIQIKTDIDDIKNVFNQYEINLPTLTKRILGKVGMGSKKAIKSNYNGYFKTRGNLYKMISYKVRKSGNSVIVYSFATNGGEGTSYKAVKYGYVLAHGATINAKTNYMTFQINGEWKKVKSVTIPSRSWFNTPVEKYIGSAAYNDDLEKVLQDQLNKYFKK